MGIPAEDKGQRRQKPGCVSYCTVRTLGLDGWHISEHPAVTNIDVSLDNGLYGLVEQHSQQTFGRVEKSF